LTTLSSRVVVLAEFMVAAVAQAVLEPAQAYQ
jgi:hypothetical protein